jgi:hypothetical protein
MFWQLQNYQKEPALHIDHPESNFRASAAEDQRQHHLPPTARYLEIVTFPGNDGQMGSATKLTGTLIWQLNNIFRCKYKISRCRERIAMLEDGLKELGTINTELNKLLNLSKNDEERKANLKGLQEAENLARQSIQDMEELENKS